jgi:hypothetical protein
MRGSEAHSCSFCASEAYMSGRLRDGSTVLADEMASTLRAQLIVGRICLDFLLKHSSTLSPFENKCL